MNCGIKNMTELYKLPLIKKGVKVHYEGSIDKLGGNADWDWWLYQDENREWVLFETEGPGCIYNFVQHRYPDSAEPTFRFYFDGEEQPRFIIRHSQFGEVYPFVEPLASRYIGPVQNGRGPIRVVRSFVPMPFAKSCKITSDVKLEGFDRALGHGGWGHVIWHSYTADFEDPVETFDKQDESLYQPLIRLWKNVGQMPVQPVNVSRQTMHALNIQPGNSVSVFSADTPGMIAAIKIQTEKFEVRHLKDIWLQITFDGHKKTDVCAPFGCIFSNELGYNAVRYLMSGMTAEGSYYCYFPMPYLNSAEILIENKGETAIAFTYTSVITSDDWNDLYASRPFGYFRTSPYYTRKHTEGADSIIAVVEGSGHMVNSIVTGFSAAPETYASCEGDVRIHFDGIRTPQIESDGSESYSCYGWGYPSPPECNPGSGYDGYNHTNFSMTRQLTGDWYPFGSNLHFAIESGGNNDCYLEHSGMVFYYGQDEIKVLRETDIPACTDNPVELTSFFEGDDDHIPVTAAGHYGEASRFTIDLPEGTDYVVLRRVSDQEKGRQRAAVRVDGEAVCDYAWYFADRNPCKRFLEDEFVIPSAFVSGKRQITAEVIPLEVDGTVTWNEFGFKILCMKF